MLCCSCRCIHFRPLRQQNPDELLYILHKTPQSFQQAIKEGCRLCLLISGKLDTNESLSQICEDLHAYIVLIGPRARHVSRQLESVGINAVLAVKVASRRGSAILDVIEHIPDSFNPTQIPNKTRLSSGSTITGIAKRPPRKRKKSNKVIDDKTAEKLVSEFKNHGPSDLSTGSITNLHLARTWFNECLKSHPHCRINGPAAGQRPLPTRLINIQTEGKPFLQPTTSKMTGSFVALSYTWGNGERVQTTKSNYKMYQKQLPVEKLPRTFCDAIHVARTFEYKYLWIDAFCIIQDDNADKSREIPNMGDIYRYADFTIYAASSMNSHAGFFSQRDFRLYRPCKVNIYISTSASSNEAPIKGEITLATTCHGPDYLESRGWILQERVLSSRCLVFGQQASWICTQGEAKETRPVLTLRPPSRTDGALYNNESLRRMLYSAVAIPKARGPFGRQSCYDTWYAVLEEYSLKELLYVSDILNAVAGLATLFQSATRATYVSGLWKEDLQHGLAWYVDLNDERAVNKDVFGSSWSWASVGKVRIKFRSWRHGFVYMNEPEWGAEVIDVVSNPSRSPDGGALGSSTTLTVRAAMRKALLKYTDDYAAQRIKQAFGESNTGFSGIDKKTHPRFPALLLDSQTNQPLAEVALDRPWHLTKDMFASNITPRGPEDRPLVVTCILLHVQRYQGDYRGTILVLRESKIENGNKMYQRIGLGFLALEAMNYFGYKGTSGVSGGQGEKGVEKETVCII